MTQQVSFSTPDEPDVSLTISPQPNEDNITLTPEIREGSFSPEISGFNMQSTDASLHPEVTSTAHRTEAREILPLQEPEASEIREEMSAELTSAQTPAVRPPASAAAASAASAVLRRGSAREDRLRERKTAPQPPPHPPASYEPASVPVSATHFSADLWDSPAVVLQDSTNLTMDSFAKNSSGFDPDVLNQSDDDFLFEMKNSSPPAFSPVSDAGDGLTAARRCVEVSDSPSPDLVQDAYDGDEDVTRPQEIKQLFDPDALTSHSYVLQHASSDLYSSMNKEADDPPMALPDILKSSPLNPEKLDSGSSEGSPDFSPAHKSANDSPNAPFSVSAKNPFGFDSKILLLKEMAEETEARAAEMAKLDTEKISEESFVAFDLVKESDAPPKSDQQLKDKEDVEMLSQTSVQLNDKFECLNFLPGKAQEHTDSESLSADSFSPVLDAVTKNTPGFPVEHDNTALREDIDEVSEQEVSSEEFEFVERPPRGAADEFLEMHDSLTSEMLVHEEQSPRLEAPHEKPATEDTKDYSSSHLLSVSDQSSPVRDKAGLESPASLIYTPVDQTGLEKMQVSRTPSLRPAAVLDLLYWRNLSWSAAVLSSSLLLLLFLSSCSIISVIAYGVLTLLSVTVTFRIYKGILQAIQKSDEGHPFKQYLDKDVALSKDLVQKYTDMALGQINSGLIALRRLFLVEDLVDSLKFAVILWIFTYVGSWFNGLTLVILGVLGAFSCPVMYEIHQTDIDQYVNMMKNQMKEILGKVEAKVPGMKKSE